jgi:MtN3 and saliva related transmembrane protein
MIPRDTTSLLIPRFQRSEIFGLVAGFGTTFAALPDLVAMLRRRSSKGMNPRMATITGIFQILWVYYGLLILSRPVVFWNLMGVLINSLSLATYCYFLKKMGKRVWRSEGYMRSYDCLHPLDFTNDRAMCICPLAVVSAITRGRSPW